jgi:hypothetical protein
VFGISDGSIAGMPPDASQRMSRFDWVRLLDPGREADALFGRSANWRSAAQFLARVLPGDGPVRPCFAGTASSARAT